ncbi:hypothetical protein C1645_811078 [Glomus cerebriforme]|uniref:Uncharacterized protein n=1 Tax=Glomus cerebriforme TaxID=658196 RepID=A0A397TNE1_9GLOM|nr:hypothetical protein C1645_811078 [Glomus cerebriforme]
MSEYFDSIEFVALDNDVEGLIIIVITGITIQSLTMVSDTGKNMSNTFLI